MTINVTGNGNRQGSPDGPLQPDPTGQRAAVANAQQAAQRGVPAPTSMGTVGGEQYPSSGAAGVTRYGLFAGGQSAAPTTSPTTSPPPMQIPGAQPPRPIQQPGVSVSRPNLQAPQNTMTGATAAPRASSAGFNAAPAASSPSTPAVRPPMQLSMQQRIAQARPLIGRSLPPGAAPPQGAPPGAASGAPPPSTGGQMQGFSAGQPSGSPQGAPPGAASGAPPPSTGGQMQGFSAGQPSGSPQPPPPAPGQAQGFSGGGQQTGLQPTDTGAMTSGPPVEDYTNANGVAKATGDSLQSAANGVAGGAGDAFGQTLASAINGYNNGMGQQSDPSFSDFFSKMAPGFQDSSLSNAVGQNMQQMMDPAAWQQMAQNQLDQRTAANTSSLNLAQRRLADSAGRTGLANSGGADADLLRNFANQQAGAQRDVYNDTLNNQMNAANMAGSYANGLRGQDVSMKNQLSAIAGQGASQDLSNAREDNPSFIKALQSLMGGAGAAAGAGSQAAGGLLSLLPLLAA